MAELGQTSDYRELIPGDPWAIHDNVTALRGRAEAMERAGDSLKHIDSGAWRGAAGDAFRDAFSYEPGRWLQAADACATCARCLTTYAETLTWAQNQAADAIVRWAQGNTATEQARQAHDRAIAEASTPNERGALPVVAPFADPGDAIRQAARDILNRARQQLTEAGDRAAAAIGDAADLAPEKSGWEEVWDGIGGVAGFIGDIGVGLWDGLSGVAKFLWDLSPHHLIDDPGHYGQIWAGLTAAAGFAVDHPVDFGRQMISWEQWAHEPGRALGNTAFGFIPVAGVLAKVKKLQALAKAVPDAPNIKAHLRDYFGGTGPPRASDLDAWARSQGWTKSQTETGPPMYVDDNKVTRLTLKSGSSRVPGSEQPHVVLRDENGQRIDPQGNPVSRRSPGNHTPIEWDW